MSDGGPLERLAERCGIEPETVDWEGHRRRVAPDVLRHLLQAAGIDAADDAGAEAALRELDRELWEQALGPLQVVRCDRPFSVDVRLPSATKELGWRITLEDGTERRGTADFPTLVRTAEHADERGKKECRRLPLPALPAGYHALTVEPGGDDTTVVATPGACWLPAAGSARLWGIAVQLYLVRSERNWGIGDFTDLRRLIAIVREHGGDVVGLNPLHALFPDNPEHASPYSPSSRLLTNVFNIDVEALPELQTSAAVRALIEQPDVQARLEECRRAELLDYREVAALKSAVLEQLFDEGRASSGERWRQFERFRRERGRPFERHCLFLALRAHFAAQDPAHADWRRWPAPYRDCRSHEVAEFARTNAAAVDYVAWVQWLADEQLAAAAADASALRVGLYADLAVGADPAGAESWSEPELGARGAHIGAPPDPMNEHGQDWGLTPINPRALRAQRYSSFIELLRANMRHAGALRIDHAMALQRLYWVPEGRPATAGTYVRYPLEDLIGILALESHRNRCIVIGEDLGTVPPGFRERMAEANVLSYRVLTFERDDSGALRPPERYPELALAVFGNHDLPTLRGWWEYGDLELRAELGQTAGADVEAQCAERRREKEALRAALHGAGLLTSDAAEPPLATLAVAVHALLGRTRALLALAQLDDIALERDPVNVPSLQQYPNWRRRLGVPLEQLAADPLLHGIAAAFDAAGRRRA